MKSTKIHLKPSCILNVPLQAYENDFSFIINGEEFKTSRLISDLLSYYLCQQHAIDPTIDTFTINTRERGDFSHILDLVKFNEISFSESELPFISEVFEQLGNDSLFCEIENNCIELTPDNVFSHYKSFHFNKNELSRDVSFISGHFYEICEKKEEELAKLSVDELFIILNHENLQLKTEDQLLKFVNKMYSKSSSYSILYETVLFENVSKEAICEFTSLFDINDITKGVWNCLKARLGQDIEMKSDISNEKRYNEQFKGEIFEMTGENKFQGIINHFLSQTSGNIESKVSITASSIGNSSENYQPRVVSLFDD